MAPLGVRVRAKDSTPHLLTQNIESVKTALAIGNGALRLHPLPLWAARGWFP